MEKWTFKTTEVELSEDVVKVSFSKGMEPDINDLLSTCFGVHFLQAEKEIKGSMIHLSFKAPIEDIENLQDALTNFYLEKYGDSGNSVLFGDNPETQN